MKRDRKLAQKKKARDKSRTTARTSAGFSSAGAASSPFGPCWMSRSWRDGTVPPALVSVVITRDLGRVFLAHMMLVDRTCLGVKSAFTVGPLTAGELAREVERVAMAHVEGVEPVDVVDAQSLVFAAVAYAARLGFRTDRDFDARIVGPAPSPLRPTPLSTPERPFYFPGPDDDQERILATLRRAVGEDGFHVGSPDDDFEDDDLDDDEMAHEQSDDERRIADAFGVALSALAPQRAPEWDIALEELLVAFDVEDELPPEHRSSLLSFWATLFRPSAHGERGIDVMQKRRPGDPAFAALAQTRAVLFEVLSIMGNLGTCRNVITGDILRVRLGNVASKATRWMRFFAYLTPMEDGTLYPPSTMLGHPWLRNVEVDAWIAKLNALLEELSVDERIDPAAPTPGLTRWGALAHATLNGLIAPTAEEREDQECSLYVVDTDGERVEYHEAILRLQPNVERRLLEALAHADDFVAGDVFAWMREPKEHGVIDGEHVALVEPMKGELRITTTSAARFAAVSSRLGALAGATLVPSHVKIVRPWEENPRAVPAETPTSRRVVVGAARVEAGEVDIVKTVLAGVRRALDEEIPHLGGRPRDLARDDARRDRVERWLRDQELRGLPSGNAFFDLDVIRRELGMPGLSLTRGQESVELPERKISETILELAAQVLGPLDQFPNLEAARSAIELTVTAWNLHALATFKDQPKPLAEVRAKLRGRQAPREIAEMFEALVELRATKYGDDPRVVGDWHFGPDGLGRHAFRCEARLASKS